MIPTIWFPFLLDLILILWILDIYQPHEKLWWNHGWGLVVVISVEWVWCKPPEAKCNFCGHSAVRPEKTFCYRHYIMCVCLKCWISVFSLSNDFQINVISRHLFWSNCNLNVVWYLFQIQFFYLLGFNYTFNSTFIVCNYSPAISMKPMIWLQWKNNPFLKPRSLYSTK